MILLDIDNKYDDITIKALTRAHTNDIKSVFRGGQDYFLKADGQRFTDQTIDELFDALPPNVPKENKVVLGFYVNGKPVAIADLVKMESGEGFHLGLLLIHGGYRRKGYGKKFFDLIEKIVENNDGKYIRIGVLFINIEAFIFWIRQGFIAKKKTKSQIGEDRFVDVVALEKKIHQTKEERGFMFFRFNKEANNKKYALRVATRAVIFSDGKMLLVRSNFGDYQFPGGALDDGEIFEEAIVREVMEETGHECTQIKKYLGAFLEKRFSRINLSYTHYLYNQYYLCEVSEERKDQILEDYEKELGYEPVFVDIDEAIINNEKVIMTDTKYKDAIIRETKVMKWLKEQY